MTRTMLITQADLAILTAGGPGVLTYRKKSRIVALEMEGPFVVETDRGPMTGVAGDFLVTNHPDDDPGSDPWSISAARMASTYDLWAALAVAVAYAEERVPRRVRAVESRPVPSGGDTAMTRTMLITQADRGILTAGGPGVLTYRKKSRIVALEMEGPFVVETDRGPMTGVAGDFLVTNHPDDDPGSDLWSISAARMASTYEEVAP